MLNSNRGVCLVCWESFVFCHGFGNVSSFSGLLHEATSCGLSSDHPSQVEVLALRNCTRDISRHCELYGLKADTVLDTEWKPLFPRAGKILCTVLPSYVNLRVLSIQPKIPEVSVRNQMEWTISVRSYQNIWERLWSWSTLTGQVISVGRTEMSPSIWQNYCPQYLCTALLYPACKNNKQTSSSL